MTETAPTLDDVASLYRTPVLDLIVRAAADHREQHDPSKEQVCVLLSIKTGGCLRTAVIVPRPRAITPASGHGPDGRR